MQAGLVQKRFNFRDLFSSLADAARDYGYFSLDDERLTRTRRVLAEGRGGGEYGGDLLGDSTGSPSAAGGRLSMAARRDGGD